ncbi:hypothetical protein ACNKHT_07575 [Shigella flexneri]
MADIEITGMSLMMHKKWKVKKACVVKKYTCLNTGYLNRSGDAVTIRVRKKEA